MRYSQARNERAAVEALAAAPGAQERLLHRVLGLVERGEHPVAVHVQLAPVPLGDVGEGRAVAGGRRGHEGSVVGTRSLHGVVDFLQRSRCCRRDR